MARAPGRLRERNADTGRTGTLRRELPPRPEHRAHHAPTRRRSTLLHAARPFPARRPDCAAPGLDHHRRSGAVRAAPARRHLLGTTPPDGRDRAGGSSRASARRLPAHRRIHRLEPARRRHRRLLRTNPIRVPERRHRRTRQHRPDRCRGIHPGTPAAPAHAARHTSSRRNRLVRARGPSAGPRRHRATRPVAPIHPQALSPAGAPASAHGNNDRWDPVHRPVRDSHQVNELFGV